MKNKAFTNAAVYLFILVLLVISSGCSTQTPVPIDRITVMKEPADHAPPPGMFAALPGTVPQSVVVGAPYHAGDKVFIILAMSNRLEGNVTLTRFTFYNQQTKAEVDLPIPKGLEPFEPGRITDIAFDDYWTVPNELGTYELRVYVGNQNAISATFAVE